jgi:hypothetical protein
VNGCGYLRCVFAPPIGTCCVSGQAAYSRTAFVIRCRGWMMASENPNRARMATPGALRTGWHPTCYKSGMRLAKMIVAGSCALLLTASGGRELQIINGIERLQLAREEQLAGYSVTEHYTLHNSRFNEAAEMTVAVSFVKGAGKSYKVLSRSGPAFLHNSVFEKVLKEQRSMSVGETREASLVTSANYRLKWLGEQNLGGRLCEAVELEPLKKSPHLLRGKAWADANTFRLIRIEGRPAASISFWAGSPYVVREYMDIGEFSFARKSHAVSQSFLLGHSELDIEYTDYHVEVK